MKKTVPHKATMQINSSPWVLVGMMVIALLFLFAYVIHSNRENEMSEKTLQNRVVNKVEEVRQVKNAVKKLVK